MKLIDTSLNLYYNSEDHVLCEFFPPPLTKYFHFPTVSEGRKYPKVPGFLEKVPVSIRKYLQVPTVTSTQIFDHF